MSIPRPKPYRVNLHILSPIHIGTEQEIDPFTYIIRDKTLFVFDLAEWIANYPDQNQISRIMGSDNFAIVRSFIAENFNSSKAVRIAIPIDSPKLLNIYDRSIKNKDPRNQVLISPTIRNDLDKTAYIPGSSIKGAIRTALANRFVKVAKVTSQDARGRLNYDQKIFGKINKDPMRWLKVADMSIGHNGTVIVEAEEYPLNTEKALTPKGYTEVALSLCHTGKPVVYPLHMSMADFALHGEKVDLNFLIEALNHFYVSKYQEEYQKFYQIERAQRIRQGTLRMNKVVADMCTNEALVRIGHFSHVECVTLDDVRKPRTRLGKDRTPLPWGKTRTLANGTYPFGWAKLEFLDLAGNPNPPKDWPFPLSGEALPGFRIEPGKREFAETPMGIPSTVGADETGGVPPTAGPTPKASPVKTLTMVEKLLKQLELIKSTDMGRIGTIIQKMETLETDREKAEVAAAIKDKIGPRLFNKHKKKDYLLELIEKGQS